MTPTPEEIEEINLKIDILALLDTHNIEYWKEGEDRYVLHCPFHAGDNEPSFKLYTEKLPHTWHCFGCKKGTNAITFLCLISGKSFAEVIGQFSENRKLSLEDKSRAIQEARHRQSTKSKAPELMAQYNISVSMKARSLFHRCPDKFDKIQGILKEVDIFLDQTHEEFEVRRFFRSIEGKIKKC